MWYHLSKTLAEEAAWKFVNENNINMIAINPGMVAGSFLQPEVKQFQIKLFGWVDVKDVANAHILAYEIASASGRYCLTEKVIHSSELARILRDLALLACLKTQTKLQMERFCIDKLSVRRNAKREEIAMVKRKTDGGRWCIQENNLIWLWKSTESSSNNAMEVDLVEACGDKEVVETWLGELEDDVAL
ncbi:hypothetical protein ACSQ67_018506 [Phaseolus vulgaris]